MNREVKINSIPAWSSPQIQITSGSPPNVAFVVVSPKSNMKYNCSRACVCVYMHERAIEIILDQTRPPLFVNAGKLSKLCLIHILYCRYQKCNT